MRTTRKRQPCEVVPFASGRELTREMDRYLAIGYDVAQAADGWVLLRRGDDRIALTTLPSKR